MVSERLLKAKDLCIWRLEQLLSWWWGLLMGQGNGACYKQMPERHPSGFGRSLGLCSALSAEALGLHAGSLCRGAGLHLLLLWREAKNSLKTRCRHRFSAPAANARCPAAQKGGIHQAKARGTMAARLGTPYPQNVHPAAWRKSLQAIVFDHRSSNYTSLSSSL